jgi:hypothetical protein
LGWTEAELAPDPGAFAVIPTSANPAPASVGNLAPVMNTTNTAAVHGDGGDTLTVNPSDLIVRCRPGRL